MYIIYNNIICLSYFHVQPAEKFHCHGELNLLHFFKPLSEYLYTPKHKNMHSLHIMAQTLIVCEMQKL